MRWLLTCCENWTSVTLAVLAAVLVLPDHSAWAGDWSIESRLSEKGDLNDNRKLAAQSPGYVFGSTSQIYVDTIHKGYDHRFDFIADVSYQKYVGADQTNASDGFSPTFQMKFNQKGKTKSLDFAAAFSRSEISSEDPLDPTSLSNTYFRNTSTASAAWSQNLDALNSIGISAMVNVKSFEHANGKAYPSISTDDKVFWKRRLTKGTDLTTTGGVSVVVQDNPAQSRSLIYKADVNLSSQLSKRLKATWGTGIHLANQYANNTNDSTSVGWVGNLGFDYTFKRGLLSASASESLDPGVLGDLQKRTSLSLSGLYKINEVSSAGFSAQYRLTTPPNNSFLNGSSIFILNPTYSLQLTPQWAMQAGYRWTDSNGAVHQAFSNEAYLSFTKSWVLLP